MFRALVLGFGQLTDPRCRRIVWVSVLGAIALAIALVVSVSWLFIGLQVTGIVWLEPVIDVLGGAATLVIAWLLFPAAIGLLVGLFLDRVSRAVEQRHYPDLPAAPGRVSGRIDQHGQACGTCDYFKPSAHASLFIYSDN